MVSSHWCCTRFTDSRVYHLVITHCRKSERNATSLTSTVFVKSGRLDQKFKSLEVRSGPHSTAIYYIFVRNRSNLKVDIKKQWSFLKVDAAASCNMAATLKSLRLIRFLFPPSTKLCLTPPAPNVQRRHTRDRLSILNGCFQI